MSRAARFQNPSSVFIVAGVFWPKTRLLSSFQSSAKIHFSSILKIYAKNRNHYKPSAVPFYRR